MKTETTNKQRGIIALTLLLALLVAACAPAATPTPTPTKPPAAAPTVAPTVAAPAPTKAPEPTKPPAPSPTPPPKPVSLKIGATQTLADAAIYVAMDKGYFAEQGITMELVNFRTAAEEIAPLGTGQIDVATVPLSASLLAAADRGVALKIVADKGQNSAGFDQSWIVLRKDLADSGKVKTAADLKGMKVAVPSQGSIGEQTVELMVEQAGLKPGDVEVVVLPFAEQASAFGNKAIAASYSVEPYIARGIQEGFSVKWIPTSKFFGGRSQGGVLTYGPTLLKDEELARRWMVPYIKGARDYFKAFTTKQDRQSIIQILIKNSTVKEPTLYDVMEMPYLDPNGQPDKKSMDAQYKWFVAKGLYTGKKTFDDLMDLSYVEYATQKLGKQ